MIFTIAILLQGIFLYISISEKKVLFSVFDRRDMIFQTSCLDEINESYSLPIVVLRCQQIEYLIMIIGTLYYTNRQSFDTCGWYLFSIVVSIDYMRKENTNSLFVFSPTYTFAEKFLFTIMDVTCIDFVV